MTAPADPLSPVKRALLEIRELRERLAVAEGLRHGPVAIVGMGFKLPGAVGDAQSFEDLLWNGVDAVTPIPTERWSMADWYSADPDAPGKMTTRFGAFVNEVDRFDAEFFGISPREAASMDPQQRLLLETAWAALENAGVAPGALASSQTGVFLGISNNDYGRALYAQRDQIDAYFGTGNAYSVASGRLSYLLGLHGPSVAVDTACSSSLVAVHLACQSLRLGESDRALAGGVNLILTPEMNINFSKANMMAPDGRCKTFDAGADGYVRGEGCVMMVLRRLPDALAAGETVLAVIRGSAINQDGRSGGLTAPNGPAQETVIRAALAAARVTASQIGYVEAHGTGTPLGDPIEVGALGAVLGAGRDPGLPLFIGSVKTNIGHLEAAAGLAGLAKVVLALRRKQIPPHLHFKSGNPHIDWDGLAIAVPTRITAWPQIEGRRLAGVSAFGFSGTNAHVIVEEAPLIEPQRASPERPRHLLALSARDAAALQEMAARYASRLGRPAAIGDVCFTANAGRSHFTHRLAIVAADVDGLRDQLGMYVAGRTDTAVATGFREGAARPQVAFLFTGQGAQYAGMGRALYGSSLVFKNALDECAAGLAPYLERGLLTVMFAGDPHDSPINDTVYAQPATFAIEYALAQLWRSWGIEPVAVMGHSLGEYAAACVAGLLPLADALRVVAERGRLTHALPAGGMMAAIFAPLEAVEAEVARNPHELAIAAFNGPQHFVISGAGEAVRAAVRRFEALGTRVKLLRVPHAAHSPLVEPALAGLRQSLESVRFEQARVTLISNVTGSPAAVDQLGHPDYWIKHMREPVRFTQSMRAMAALGITHFIEIGPHPVLLGMGAECTPGEAEWLTSLHRDRSDWTDLLESLQRLYVGGAEVDWHGFDSGYARRRVDLPTYPFRRRRHWSAAVDNAPASASGVLLSAERRWSRLRQSMQTQSERGPLDLNAASYSDKWRCLEQLTVAHSLQVLRTAEVFRRAGGRLTLDEVLLSAGIAPTYRHLIRRWLDRLAASGVLRVDGTSYVADRALPEPELERCWSDAERLFADNRSLLAYVRHCGKLLGAVLLGTESPLETLFPGGSFEIADGLYRHSTTMRYVNELAAAAFTSLAADRTLRILEVGAGTGGTTAALLPTLPAERVRYRFTDVSEFFFERARSEFAAYPFVEYARFDLEQETAKQGYADGSFDLIVSSNAVHASSDLRAALQRLRRLLAPGGMLVLVESTTHLAWFDMTTGLIEGWQHFVDDLRTDNPLLAADAWLIALREAGFDTAGAWPPAGSPAEILGQHVLIAAIDGDAFSGQLSTESAPQSHAVTASAGPREAADAFKRRIVAALPDDRSELLRDFVRDRVVRVLRLDASEPPSRSDRLMDLGFDSLMAVQLRNLLAKELELGDSLPATIMFDHPTIDALGSYLLGRLGSAVPAPAHPPAEAVRAEPALPPGQLGVEAVAAMSESEIEALLLERLGS